MAGKKIKLEEEAISEIPVADTDSKSGAKVRDVEDYLEEEEEGGRGRREQQQQQQPSAEVTITNTGQRNQPNCAAACVLLMAKERTQCISAPDVMWACAWCLVSQNITQK